MGLSSLQKMTIAMHMLSFGTHVKAHEEYCWMAPSVAWESMLHWCRGVQRCFYGEYPRQSTQVDILK